MKSKKIKATFIVLTSLVTALLITFIFSNSLKTPSVSTGQSSGMYDKVVNCLENTLGERFVSWFTGFFNEHLLRKIAHVIEYVTLGVSVNLMFLSVFGVKSKCLYFSSGVGLAVASLDETLQIFSGRGARVSDVVLDFISFTVVTLIFLIVYLVKEKKVKKPNPDAEKDD